MPGEWVTWALQGLIAVVLIRIWSQLDRATAAIAALAILVADQYVTKLEWAREWGIVRDRLHDLTASVAALRALQQMADARSGAQPGEWGTMKNRREE
jgi:hypothetical protein